MPGLPLVPLLAIHISDGILSGPWVIGGFVLASALALVGSWRIQDEEIPRIALMTAAFFVASLIRVPVPPTSVHLFFNGLVGVVLGWRAALAIPIGLFLQAALMGHGGFTSLGINSCVMGIPALVSGQTFVLLQRVPWLRQSWFRAGLVITSSMTWLLSLVYGSVLLFARSESGIDRATTITFHPFTIAGVLAVALAAAWLERRCESAPEFPIGLFLGQFSVLATALLACLVLAWGGQEPESWQTLVQVLFIAHLPIALVEGIVLGFTIGFLVRVKPEMLRWKLSEETECSVDPLL
jgi:cobalt/nickel transport system permease protein